VVLTAGISIKEAKYMWHESNNKLVTEYKFPDFKSALGFVNKVGGLAEQQNHHPDVELAWGRVKITLQTHSEGKVTYKDRQLAQAIDTLQSSE
jgi:4a-hydroxytetrahydrobiopterin dehydratase